LKVESSPERVGHNVIIPSVLSFRSSQKMMRRQIVFRTEISRDIMGFTSSLKVKCRFCKEAIHASHVLYVSPRLHRANKFPRLVLPSGVCSLRQIDSLTSHICHSKSLSLQSISLSTTIYLVLLKNCLKPGSSLFRAKAGNCTTDCNSPDTPA
jgi:hypothetical protein